ncbi:MAG TPA: phage tail protein [Bacillota bacterium]|nr:phage tail protein [Bacillota bacterium]
MSQKREAGLYLKYLPPVFQTGESDPGNAGLLGRFLNAFQQMLTGMDDGVSAGGNSIRGLAETVDGLVDYFDPATAPAGFLPWLASWVALDLKESDEWNEENARKKRDLIKQIVPLYKKRGTLAGLLGYLRVYAGDVDIAIHDFKAPFCLGYDSTIHADTVVGEGRPFYFEVNMVLPAHNRDYLEKRMTEIREIIDQEKPAHTYYRLYVTVPRMQINKCATIGVNTLLGGMIG